MSELDYLKIIVTMVVGLSAIMFITGLGMAYQLGTINGTLKALVEILTEEADDGK